MIINNFKNLRRCNSNNNTGGGGQNNPWYFKNFNFNMNQVRKTGSIRLSAGFYFVFVFALPKQSLRIYF